MKAFKKLLVLLFILVLVSPFLTPINETNAAENSKNNPVFVTESDGKYDIILNDTQEYTLKPILPDSEMTIGTVSAKKGSNIHTISGRPMVLQFRPTAENAYRISPKSNSKLYFAPNTADSLFSDGKVRANQKIILSKRTTYSYCLSFNESDLSVTFLLTVGNNTFSLGFADEDSAARCGTVLLKQYDTAITDLTTHWYLCNSAGEPLKIIICHRDANGVRFEDNSYNGFRAAKYVKERMQRNGNVFDVSGAINAAHNEKVLDSGITPAELIDQLGKRSDWYEYDLTFDDEYLFSYKNPDISCGDIIYATCMTGCTDGPLYIVTDIDGFGRIKVNNQIEAKPFPLGPSTCHQTVLTYHILCNDNQICSSIAKSKLEASTCFIMSESGCCTGSYVGLYEGSQLILTCGHSIENTSEKVFMIHGGNAYALSLYKYDPQNDYALFKSESPAAFTSKLHASATAPVIHSSVYTFGYPHATAYINKERIETSTAVFHQATIDNLMDNGTYLLQEAVGLSGTSGSAIVSCDGLLVGIVLYYVNSEIDTPTNTGFLAIHQIPELIKILNSTN